MNDKSQVKSMPVDELVALLAKMPSDPLNQAAEVITTLQSQLTQMTEKLAELWANTETIINDRTKDLTTQLTQAQEEITKLGKSAELDIATAKSRRLLLGSDPPVCNCLNEAPTFPTCREHPHKENCKLKRVWDASINLIDILFRNDQKWADKLTQAHNEREEAAAVCAVMRKFIDDWCCGCSATDLTLFIEARANATSTNCGKAFLERMKEAEWLIANRGVCHWDEWIKRHAAWVVSSPADAQKGECL